METSVTVLCFLVFLMLLFFVTKRQSQKYCMEAINTSEERCEEYPIGSDRNKPYREDGDGRKWHRINGEWILVWPRTPHRLNELNKSRHCWHRRRKLRVEKTDLKPIQEGDENELQTETEPELELEPAGPYRGGTFWLLSAPCLDDLENTPEHPLKKVHNVPRQQEFLQSQRPGGFKNLFLESFRCCIGQGPVD